jgi:membrane dipeptidase
MLSLLALLATPLAVTSALPLPHHAIIIDTHSDCTQRLTYDHVDLARPQPDMQVDVPKMRAGGLDAEFFSIFVGPWSAKPDAYFTEALRQFDAVHALIDANPNTITWAKTAADVRTNQSAGCSPPSSASRAVTRSCRGTPTS